VVVSVVAAIWPNVVAIESPVPLLNLTNISPVGLPAFFKITLTLFTELPINIEADVVISPALWKPPEFNTM
jgi:hypothetical protein